MLCCATFVVVHALLLNYPNLNPSDCDIDFLKSISEVLVDQYALPLNQILKQRFQNFLPSFVPQIIDVHHAPTLLLIRCQLLHLIEPAHLHDEETLSRFHLSAGRQNCLDSAMT